MKRVRTSELIPGMTTVEDVYSFNNQLVVGKGTVLDDELIQRLEYYSVLSIHVDDEAPVSTTKPLESLDSFFTDIPDIPDIGDIDDTADTAEKGTETESDAKPVASTTKDTTKKHSSALKPLFSFTEENGFSTTSEKLSYSERVKSTPQFKEFREAFVTNAVELDKKLHDIIEYDSIDTDELLSSVSNLLSENITSIGMFDMFHNLRTYDDLTYVHSMNVALICNIIGRWIHMNDDDLEVLTLAGLLHDIGKVAVPSDIISKPGKLTTAEYNRVKKHTVEGYKVLKNLPIDERIKNAALLHHERCDGTGYPLNYTDEKIPDFAKIVAIADVYDAMTAARTYRGPMCPFNVISMFEEEGLQKYDSRFLLPFLENIGQTYMNNRVRLSDGREGDIVLIHKNCISRPLIRLTDGSFIDLSENKNIRIEDLV